MPHHEKKLHHPKHHGTQPENSQTIVYTNNYFIINEYCCCKPQPVSLTSRKFFSKVSAGAISGSDLQIPAVSFVDDNGVAITIFPTTFYYFNLFINGMIQENGVALVTTSQLTIKDGSKLDMDDPITLEIIISV